MKNKWDELTYEDNTHKQNNEQKTLFPTVQSLWYNVVVKLENNLILFKLTVILTFKWCLFGYSETQTYGKK